MPEGNTQYKDHVRAAREWLGRAENSLEQDDHIRGDLDVMLAQAELQRAQEMDEGALRRRWLRRLLPAGTAAILAGIAWGLWPAEPETPPGEAVMAAAPAPLARQEETVFVSPEQKIGERVSTNESGRAEPAGTVVSFKGNRVRQSPAFIKRPLILGGLIFEKKDVSSPGLHGRIDREFHIDVGD